LDIMKGWEGAIPNRRDLYLLSNFRNLVKFEGLSKTTALEHKKK
jgi:hypothetical protein